MKLCKSSDKSFVLIHFCPANVNIWIDFENTHDRKQSLPLPNHIIATMLRLTCYKTR